MYNQHMKKVKNSSIAYVFYALATIDYVSANFFNNDLTGLPFSPIILGGIGSVFMFIHNSYIKESNNKIYELFKFSLYAVLISDDRIDESELEYSSSILNTLENELLLPTNPSKLEEELVNYNLNNLYEKIRNLQSSVPYKTKLDILSSCAILCVMDGQIDEVEQETIYQISNILDISPNDMKNIFNASIASYIDFQNSDREKLQINDSEVKKVVEEKRKENKSNKNQVYIGIGVFTSLVFFGIYQSFQVTIEESCTNFINYENSYIDLSNQTVDPYNENLEMYNSFVDAANKDSYANLNSNDQIMLHSSIFEGYKDNLNKISDVFSKMDNYDDFDISNEHKDIEKVVIDFYSWKNLDIEVIKLEIELLNLNEELVLIYEGFFYEWDNSTDNVEKTIAQNNFDEFKSLNSKLKEDLDLKSFITLENKAFDVYQRSANEVCGTSFGE